MIQKIRDAFSELLEEVPWMDDQTKVVAREKVSLSTSLYVSLSLSLSLSVSSDTQ